MPRGLRIAWRCRSGGPGGAGRGKPTGLRDHAVQHLQDALQFLAFDHADGAVYALPAQLEAERILLARDGQPVGEFGGGGARFENLRRGLRHRRRGLGDGGLALEGDRFAAQFSRCALRQIRSIGDVVRRTLEYCNLTSANTTMRPDVPH